MQLIEQIYIGKSITDLGTIFYCLKRNIPIVNLYCICMLENTKHLLEIMSTKQLFLQRNVCKPYWIVGIAAGKAEAYDLTKAIFQDCLERGILMNEMNEWKEKIKL